MFNKILLASDGSEHALKATEKAKMLALNNPAASIEIVYVVNGSTTKTDVLHNWNTLDVEQQQRERLKQTEQCLISAGISYEIRILHGEPGPALVDFANHHDFDCLVIGSRGLNSLQEMVLGSVSHKVAKRANCPVLIVKN
ncbi:MAG TPA: universal stress protein [Bacillales bacterium]|nr:universal stress protein [Bacillales bacterium]